MGKPRGKHPYRKKVATRGRKPRGVTDEEAKLFRKVKMIPHWPYVTLDGECLELHQRLIGGAFKPGVVAYDRIQRMIKNARQRLPKSKEPGDVKRLAAVKAVVGRGLGPEHEALEKEVVALRA